MLSKMAFCLMLYDENHEVVAMKGRLLDLKTYTFLKTTIVVANDDTAHYLTHEAT